MKYYNSVIQLKATIKGFMDFIRNYWVLIALSLWFLFKWWSARKMITLLPELKIKGAILIDVRSPGEFAAQSAPNSLNIPLTELGQRLQEIPRNVPVIVACASGTRSGMAKMLLKKNGFSEVYNLGAWTNFLK
jgi:rhodanese-related sulfurtransferase